MITLGLEGSTSYAKTGKRYNPNTNAWSAMSNATIGRYNTCSVWTGKYLIVFGGSASSASIRSLEYYVPF